MPELERSCPAGCDNGAVIADVCCRVYLENGSCCNQPDREDVPCDVCNGAGYVVERAQGGPSVDAPDTLSPYPMRDVDVDETSLSKSPSGEPPWVR